MPERVGAAGCWSPLGPLLALLAGVPRGLRAVGRSWWSLVVARVLLAAFPPRAPGSCRSRWSSSSWWWALHVGSAMPVGALVAAAALLAAHVAAMLLGLRPARLALDPQLVRALGGARRPLAWLGRPGRVGRGAARYSGHGPPGVFWLAGLAAALVGRGRGRGSWRRRAEHGGPRVSARPRGVRRAGAHLRRAGPARPGHDVRRDRGGRRPGRSAAAGPAWSAR